MNHRLKTQEALEKERAFLGYLFNNNPEAIVLTDRNNHVVEVNESFCRTFGYSKDESVGKHIDELVAIGTYFYEEATDISLKVSSGSMVDVESVRRKKDGTLFEVAITAVPVIFKDKFFGIYTIYRDTSEKKRAEKKIREYVDYLKRVWIRPYGPWDRRWKKGISLQLAINEGWQSLQGPLQLA